MSQACASWRGDIGAYLVGALDPAEESRVRRHLRRCRDCRADYTELVPVREWLGRLATPDGMPMPPGMQLHPPLAPVRPLPARWRRWWAIGGAAAASVAAATVLALQLSAGPARPAFAAVDRATGVHGQAELRATATGTQIDLSVSGLPSGERCTLVAVSPSGTAVAGTWQATYDGTAHITGISAISVGQLTALRIESPTAQLLLSIHV
jgi:predicted anti-sigma-YlaC factor YlaD